MGTFMVATLPILRGGSASFNARLTGQGMNEWFTGLKRERPATELSSMALIGFDIAQAVDESDPTAIAYATLVNSNSQMSPALLGSIMGTPHRKVKSMSFTRDRGF